MSELLKDKVCIVTGAAQGIGKSIALKMIEDGAIVYGCDRLEGSMSALELEFERFQRPKYPEMKQARYCIVSLIYKSCNRND